MLPHGTRVDGTLDFHIWTLCWLSYMAGLLTPAPAVGLYLSCLCSCLQNSPIPAEIQARIFSLLSHPDVPDTTCTCTCHIQHWPYHMTSRLQGREVAGVQALGFNWVLILACHLGTMALGGYLPLCASAFPSVKWG